MLARLSLKSEPLWLRWQGTSHSLFHPLLLLPGDGGEGVQVEAALLLACSPLLRRTLPSNFCCSHSDMSVILPSTTSAPLAHLAQIIAEGNVTIANEALADFGALLTLLEVDMDRTTKGKTARKKTQEEEWNLSSNQLPRLLSPPQTPPSSAAKARNSTIGSPKSVQTLTCVSQKPPKDLSTTPGPAPASSLLVSIPLKSLSSETVQKISCTQENQTCPWSSEARAASPTPRGKAAPLPRSCPSRPPVTCIFCDITMPIGTDQGLYLQHLEVPFALYLYPTIALLSCVLQGQI